MRFRHQLASSCLAATLALCPTIGNAGPWVPAPKEYSSEVRISLFSANDFHFADGMRGSFAGGGHYDERKLTLWNEFGWKKNMSAVIGLPFTEITRTVGNVAATNAGASDMFLGLRYRVMGGQPGSRGVVSLEAGWKAPLGYDAGVRIDRATLAFLDSTVLEGYPQRDSANVVRQLVPRRIGEGQQDLQALLQFGLALPQWRGFFEGGAGYRYRFDEPNDQILLGADVGYWLSTHLLVSGHYEGTLAVNEDSDFDPNGYQEQLVGPRLTVRVDDRFDMYAGSLHSAGAENAPHKDQVYVGFTMKQTGLNRYQGFLGSSKTP